jgi:LPXTG-motif cell wall-anchored protein
VASQDDPAVTAAPPEDTLPRTGMETAVLALIGLGLLAGGVAVRRVPAVQRPSR